MSHISTSGDDTNNALQHNLKLDQRSFYQYKTGIIRFKWNQQAEGDVHAGS
ncbi:hypothetical protein [Photobacterium leiognathi]|uniref:hypothetical protein n=1 Tax=Photobacterium leiognathi TaxID=553611 RepID=UPI002980BC4F|nr:hypothetical protein [Photobacterium leiognathi]